MPSLTLVLLGLGGTQLLDLEQRMEERFAQLQARVNHLEAENDRLRKAPQSFREISPSGEVKGRRMSASPNECCRWTPDGTCTGVASGRFEACTFYHEYLETKTTTHSFADITDCAGADESGWAAEFNGVTGNLTLKNGATVQSTFPTPLKVTHSAACTTGVQPTLDLQLDTTAGVLNVAESLSLQGTDLTSKLLAPLANRSVPTYARYQEWACDGKNHFMSYGSGKTFQECQDLCDAGPTCASFEYIDLDNSCQGSLTTNACLGSNGHHAPGYTCVPTPATCARVRCLLRLCSHAPGPPADARALPFAWLTHTHTHTARCATRAEVRNLTIVLWCVPWQAERQNCACSG